MFGIFFVIVSVFPTVATDVTFTVSECGVVRACGFMNWACCGHSPADIAAWSAVGWFVSSPLVSSPLLSHRRRRHSAAGPPCPAQLPHHSCRQTYDTAATAGPRHRSASSVQPATAVCRRMEIAVMQPRGAVGLRPTHSMLQIALLMTTRSSPLTLHTQQLLARPRPSCTRLHFSRRPSQPSAQWSVNVWGAHGDTGVKGHVLNYPVNGNAK